MFVRPQRRQAIASIVINFRAAFGVNSNHSGLGKLRFQIIRRGGDMQNVFGNLLLVAAVALHFSGAPASLSLASASMALIAYALRPRPTVQR